MIKKENVTKKQILQICFAAFTLIMIIKIAHAGYEFGQWLKVH